VTPAAHTATVLPVDQGDDGHWQGTELSPAEQAIDAMLAESHLALAHELPAMARRYVSAFGGTDATCYLVDLQQTVLVPFLDQTAPDARSRVELSVDSTLAGRAFRHVEVVVQRNEGAPGVIWLPLLDGTERLGVMGVSVPQGSDAALSREPAGALLRRFASLMGEMIMTKTMYGDTVVRLRRKEPMGLAAELQWSLLPPLTVASKHVTLAAVLEPAYEVSGDTFDYAVDAGVTKVAVFDGMGHGLRSAQLATMAVSAYRHARRAGRSLIETCRDIDEVLLETFAGATFTTAVLAELDTDTGMLRWVSAGHPAPLLLRRGQLVKPLETIRRPPLGIHLPASLRESGMINEPIVGSEQLEPADSVLFYTDGVTEARAPDGSFFGEQRLVDLIVRHLAAEMPAPETMRRVVRALLDHQNDRLTDDASLALLQWRSGLDSVLSSPSDGQDQP
jgi:stage II sporulation SpoE-like protein